MADFKTSYAITMGNEGGYSNNKNDRGGETYKGIARKRHPLWSGWQEIDECRKQANFPFNLKNNMTLDKLVSAFYKEQFWNKLNLDQVNDQRLATELFDTGVNCGPGVAANFLQRALNITNRGEKDYPNLVLDGSIGPLTINRLNHHSRPNDILKILNILQGNKYIEIAEANESQEEFTSGWLTRVAL
jgi:lysozyme family protein